MKIKATHTVKIGFEGQAGVPPVQLYEGEVYEDLPDEIVKTALAINVANEVGALASIKKVVSPSVKKGGDSDNPLKKTSKAKVD